MKNMKRVLALLGVFILLLAAFLPMLFAFGTGEGSQGRFKAALGIAIVVPVLAYGIWLVYKVLNGRGKPEPEGRIRNIVFDLGNVLLQFAWEDYLDSFGFEAGERELLADTIFRSPIWGERDRSSQPEEYYIKQMIAAAPDHEENIRRVMAESEKTIRPTEYAQTWISYLKEQGYDLYILSNYAQDTLDKTRHLMTFLPLMDGAVFSCEEKLIKPEPEIYRLLLTRYQLEPARTIFIDDRPDNCRVARDLGLHTIEFHDFRQAAQELEALLKKK